MSVLSHRVVESRRNSGLFLLTPKVRSNRSGSSVSLRVCWIHFQQSPDVHCAQMGCAYAGVGNRTGILDPSTRNTENRIDVQKGWIGCVSGSKCVQFRMARGSITYLTEVTCILGCPYPSVCCLDSPRKWDELGLDSRPCDGWVAPAGKERHPLIGIGGTSRGGVT